MKHGHTNLIVCPPVRYKWDTDACWTPIPHVFDTWSYVSHLKVLFFGSDIRRTWLDMTRMQPEHNLILFSNYLMNQKRIQKSNFI